MHHDAKEIAELIRKAFRGVTLGEGIGLWEGQAIDDYQDEATRRRLRHRDEKRDWKSIPVSTLNRCQSSLCFFDAEGMRFHLPAFMLAELERTTDVSCVFHLTHLDDYAKSKMTALSSDQRTAVREFLVYLRDLPDYEFDRPQMDLALSEFWTSGDVVKKS